MRNRTVYVGLFFPPTVGYFADVLQGVQEYARRNPTWVVEICPTYRDAAGSLKHWNPHGVLFNMDPLEDWATLVKSFGGPAVQVGGLTRSSFTSVSTDNPAIGRMAGEHLLQKGFQNFAFCGYSALDWSEDRLKGFQSALHAAGRTCAVFPDQEISLHARDVERGIGQWIAALPKPLAVFCCHDRTGALIGKACEVLKIRVPHEVAILGVDNNTSECQFTDPPLSSIMGSARRIGYEAAVLLDQMFRGEKVPARNMCIPPAGVKVRQSTDVLAVEDPDVAAALTYIWEHAGDNIHVGMVAHAVLVTRRMLERKFRAILKKSPREEILRSHIEQAKKLLISTNLSALDIAMQSGFPSSSKFSAVFKRETGLSPTAFRQRYGATLY